MFNLAIGGSGNSSLRKFEIINHRIVNINCVGRTKMGIKVITCNLQKERKKGIVKPQKTKWRYVCN